jgi:hypothetical protein
MPADATRGVIRRRSPARAAVLVVGLVVVVAIGVAVALTALKGGGSSTSAADTSAVSKQAAGGSADGHHAHAVVVAAPGETRVVVLNGTSTTGLAHRLSAGLRHSGYSRATPQDGTPPGSFQTTVVEYAPGHHAEAQAVAHALGESELQPLETSVGSLAGGAPVVVIAGQDKAVEGGEGGGESSTSAGEGGSSGGEGSPGGGASP